MRDLSWGSGAVDESLLPPEGQQRLLHRTFEFWVNPEVGRRREAGFPDCAQVIMNIGERSVVRLNDEAMGGFHAVAVLKSCVLSDEGEWLSSTGPDDTI
jgi:hypothetical protein